jgi:NTP pyrophosphatase (non-canonical NTP hydrolase)
MAIDQIIIDAVKQELDRIEKKGYTLQSLHETWALLLEELDEVWDITREKPKNRNLNKLRHEFTQIAALAILGMDAAHTFGSRRK